MGNSLVVMGKSAEYRPPAIRECVPYDGAFVVCRDSQDMGDLCAALERKALCVCVKEVAESVAPDTVSRALTFSYLQPQTVMIIAWKVDVPSSVIQASEEQGCPLIIGTDEHDAKEVARLAMSTFIRRNKQHKPTWVTWKTLPSHPGQLTVWHKMTSRAVTQAAKDGCTHIVSLLGDVEKPHLIDEACQRQNVQWLWVNIQGAKEDTLIDGVETLRNGLLATREFLGESSKVLIHCSAGIHRTGTFTYALLRSLGLPPEDARRLLYDIRPVTARQVGEARLAIAENHLVLDS